MIPVRASNRPGSPLHTRGPLWITVHETGNTRVGAGAKMHADFVYYGGGSSNVSFHFAVDHLGAYQMLPCDEIGYHASDGCDNWEGDLGCFASVAIETCVDSNNINKEQTRANLIALMSMIITGHPDIDFGNTDPKRFSADRIATHNKWAYDKKWCPTYMLNDGFVPKLRPLTIANINSSTPVVIPDASFKVGDTLQTTDALNVRKGYGTKYDIVKTLPAGTKVTVIADDSGHFAVSASGYDWNNIKFEGGTGWAANTWLERVESAVPEPEKLPTLTLEYALPFRDTRGFNGKILETLKAGTKTEILSGPDTADGINWYQVKLADGRKGWVPQSILWAVKISPTG